MTAAALPGPTTGSGHDAAGNAGGRFRLTPDRPGSADRILGRRRSGTRFTPRGSVRVSTAGATALDLVGYVQGAGGLDRVASVLLELAEVLDPIQLVDAAKGSSVLRAQRLAYLLEQVGARDITGPLNEYVRDRARRITPRWCPQRRPAQRRVRETGACTSMRA